MIRSRHGLLSMMTICALLHARAADAQLAANAKTLTVTTTNAVATFNGPDLVGFVNLLTNETYLKIPSNGDLVQVDALAASGQLQTSNWSVGTESGTAVPLATITAQGSGRTFTMTVKIDSASQEIVLRSSAAVTSGGVRGAGWSIAGMDLTAGRWIVPAKSGVVFDREHPGLNSYLEYPFSWHAQMAVYEAPLGSLLLYSTDSQYAFKQLRHSSRAEGTIDVGVFTEADAPWPSASTVPSVEWRLKGYAGNWRVAAQTFRTWMLANRPPVSNAAHPWVANIRTVVGIGSGNQDSSLLAPLAAQMNPSQTLLYLIDWRQTGYDVNYPDYTPAQNTAAFISAAHALGFKVMVHTDLVGVAPDNADFAAVQTYQTRTSETLQPMGWNWDKPASTPQRYAIINPAAAAFRSLWIARVGAAIAAVNPDALHLDFNGIYNDGNGPIAGLRFPQGYVQFHSEIVNAFPAIALGGELQTDIDYRFYSFAQAGLGMAYVPAPGHPIVTFLFSPHTVTYGHLSTTSVTETGGGEGPTNGRFKYAFVEDQLRAVFPLRQVGSTNDLDTTNPNIARFVTIARSWQDNAWQPTWTADWTGTLIRYQGSGGATAALTDTGQLLSLSTPQSPIFQIAHDTTQLTTASFIDRWPAFSVSSLYGMDPSKPYFVDSVPRPDATHASSLPPGIRVGGGTRVTTSFAHLEFESAASFDFSNVTPSHAHAGVRYQGTDYPLANGAVVNPLNTTAGGVTRLGVFVHPPWQAQLGGETFVEYSVPVPSDGALRFSVGIDDGASCTDGVTFRVTIGTTEIWHSTYGRGAWHDAAVSLAAYSGTTVALRLISNPGPAANANCDWSSWTNVELVGANPAVSIPMILVPGAVFSGIDGGQYSATSASSGTVTTAAAPGAFTIFTKPGPTVGPGTNLATLPFDVWQSIRGELPRPGTIFGAGSVGPQTAGGVLKSPGIFAHPPHSGRTVMSWVVRLPASALRLGWSAGVTDGATSSDGVDFEVSINGQPYWRLTDGANGRDRWTPGSLDLSRWSGQSILVELTTDSREDNNFDWAAWADLVLSASGVSCAYSVPATTSVGPLGGSFSASVTATATCPWSASTSVPWITVTSGSGAGNGSVMYAVAPNGGQTRTGTLTIGGQTLTVTQDGTQPTMMLDRSSLHFAAVSNGAGFLSKTASQIVRMTQSGVGTVSWTVQSNQPWLTVSPTSGSGSAIFTISVQFAAGLLTENSGTITLSLPGAGNASEPIAAVLNLLPNGASSGPLGSFDTPIDGTTGIAGSIAVTGWALDDVQVTRVTICRDVAGPPSPPGDPNCGGAAKAYIGDATFVDGARPDVQASYASWPMNTRAGWGYLMLTNFLPGLGNGTFVLTAYAFDADGHTMVLGTKTITCDNAHATAPFGAIDTPGQGVTVSGIVGNTGWVLSPGNARADPPGGGVVRVLVDGIDKGTPPTSLFTSRPDLQALFSKTQYSGVDTALGIFGLDTTALTNGVHTLAWVVTATDGGASGVGSRYFTVSNGTALRMAPTDSRLTRTALSADVDTAPPDDAPIRARRGFDPDRPLQIATPSRGRFEIPAEELDRIELRLSTGTGHHYTGYFRTVSGPMPLPVGSTLDPSTGTFTWMPGVGFIGRYDLVFVRWNGGTPAAHQDVRIVLHPKGSNRVGPQTIVDVPGTGHAFRAGEPFYLGGWAADLDSTFDTGVDTVHVWAYPLDASSRALDPIFLGPAIYGGARRDVGAVYGERFTDSGYGIIVNGLPPGTYDLAVFAFSIVVNNFTPAQIVRVTVR